MTGKKERSSGGGPALGRALVRYHNQMAREAKDKDAALRRQQRRTVALESVTELTDIELVLENAEEADRIYSVANPAPALRIDLDSASGVGTVITGERRKQQKKEEALHASSLQVPRRPPWDSNMSVDELDANERQAFLAWRRSLARLEENEKLVLTPFEKNLDVWRQLWRVLERSDLLVMVVDARDPLFYRCPDLETYAKEIDEYKNTMLLVNKSDLLPSHIRRKWANYFQQHGILYVFWSAKVASATLEGKKLNTILIEQNCAQESFLAEDTKICSRDELLARLQREAEAIVQKRMSNKKPLSEGDHSSFNGERASAFKQVVVGFVGYPNVGKSSTINAIVGEKRTGVTSTPGKTKHFQTIIISNELMLCDCPGLVFPSFSSSRYDMVASGVLPIDRMTEHRGAVQVVASHVPRSTLESIYNIVLPKPKPYESQNRPPLALELLRAYCSSRGYVGASGLPDETRAARQILKDYIDGKLPHFAVPPDDVEDSDGDLQDGLLGSNSATDSDSDSEEDEDVVSAKGDGDVSEKPDISDLLDDLTAFDRASGMRSATASEKKKKPVSSHKHHRKPQRKKDRSWRVGNDGEDGMPIVRVFQKPAVNFATIKTNV